MAARVHTVTARPKPVLAQCDENDAYFSREHADTRCFYERTDWFWPRQEHLLALCLFLITVYRTAFLLYFLIEHLFHGNKFTYWSYSLDWVFDAVYLASTLSGYWSFAILNLLFLPMVLGTTSIVSLLIVVLVHLNDWPYLRSTVFGLGTLGINDIHTGDWLLHVLPIAFRFILLCAGQGEACRALINALFSCTSSRTAFLYTLWFYASPVLMWGSYWIVHDPIMEYEIPYSWPMCFFLIVFIQLLCQTYFYLLLTHRGHSSASHHVCTSITVLRNAVAHRSPVEVLCI